MYRERDTSNDDSRRHRSLVNGGIDGFGAGLGIGRPIGGLVLRLSSRTRSEVVMVGSTAERHDGLFYAWVVELWAIGDYSVAR